MIDRRIQRLLKNLSGIRYMKTLPDMLFVVDVMREYTAVHEANVKGIPVLSLVDTNCDPGGVDYLIPANDDAIRAIKLLVGKMADAVLEGKDMRKDEEELDEAAVLEGASDAESVRHKVSLEEEISDEELLGAATLAKLTNKDDDSDEDEDHFDDDEDEDEN
jgi:small subunit ribosomal protein S2